VLGGCGLSPSYLITSACPKAHAWGAVDRHYIPKGLNALKKDTRKLVHALQRQCLNSYTYSSLRLVPRLVFGGMSTIAYIINHFALSQDSCLGAVDYRLYISLRLVPRLVLGGAVEHHYIPKGLNALKKD
jgi:hypothetical protein